MNAQEILATVPLFSGVKERYLANLARQCRERSFKSGDTVVRQGNPGEGLFVIVSGRVRVEKHMEDGAVVVIANHGPGDVIGEMSVLDGATRSASVVAESDTECLVLVSWDFNAFLKSHPEVALDILPVVVKRFRETNEALLQLKSGA